MSLIKLLRKKFRTTLFTTPSHSQKMFLVSKFRGFYKYDISETDTHNPAIALDLAEKRASEIYGTISTHFLTNGSSSGVIAAVLASVSYGDKILLWDNAHPCHKNAVELSGAEAIFYSLEKDNEWGIYKNLEPQNLEEHLKGNKIKAVIVTSPTYEGITCDILKIKEICKMYGCYLIVDEAHGALYPFSEELPQSAVNYADFTIQSLHKTAGGLNPTALLHCNCDLDIKSNLKKITTTSPSYPLLMSIESNINFLNSIRGRKKIQELIKNIEKLKNNCPNVEFYTSDITKINIKIKNLTGYELSKKLFEKNIEDERANEKSVMLLSGIGTDESKFCRLEKVLKKIY